MGDAERTGLHARLAAHETRLAAQDTEIARLKRRRRLPRRFLPLALAALLVALVPLSALAVNPFTDLNPGSVHNADIDAIDTAGITTGCTPTTYCPNENVTREQMASLLARTAGLGTNPPVANAKTVGGYAPNDLLRVASAQDDTNGGSVKPLPSLVYTPYVTLTITAPRAGFVLVNGQAYFQRTANDTNLVRTRIRYTGDDSFSANVFSTIDGSGGDGIGLSWVFPVAAGEQTFVLESRPNDAQWAAGSGVLTALFVPFGATGGNTLSIVAP